MPITRMQNPDTKELYDVPEEALKMAQARGLVPVQVATLPEQKAALAQVPQRDPVQASAAGPSGLMAKLEEIAHMMNQGGPGDWRNILNAVTPGLSMGTIPVQAAKWGPAAKDMSKVRDLSELLEPAPTVLKSIETRGFTTPMAAMAAPAASAMRSGVAGVRKVTDAGAGAAKVAAALAAKNPKKTAITALLGNHLSGDPANIYGLIKRILHSDDEDERYNSNTQKEE